MSVGLSFEIVEWLLELNAVLLQVVYSLVYHRKHSPFGNTVRSLTESASRQAEEERRARQVRDAPRE
eukprot:1836843-Rhodomonas_salina.2